MNKKYKLTDQTIEINRGSDIVTLYRIQALKDFDDVRKGDLGGYIESESNLSQEGDCWIYGDSTVYDYATVEGNAKVFIKASIYDNASVYGNARVCDRVIINNYSEVCENSLICNGSYVSGNSKVYGNAQIYGESQIYNNAKIYGNAQIYNNSIISGNAKIYGKARIYGSCLIYDEACISGDSIVCGNAEIGGDAKIMKSSDYIVFTEWWINSNKKSLTWTKSNNMWKNNNFYGTGEDLLEKAYLEGGERSKIEYKRIIDYVNSIQQNDDYIKREKLMKYVDNILKGYEQKI